MADLKTFGLRVKELRAIRKLTQDELAEECEINSKYLSRMEMGHHFPSFEVLSKIAESLGVDMLELFDFGHSAKSAGEMRKEMRAMLDGADEENLRTAYRTLKAILR
ncbi:MAG: helix-turn-helix transcriptional regulator [Nitrospinae bacterium]|nr:helix-turn-helix transcriptional regulator [Nitrospinota bacterium]